MTRSPRSTAGSPTAAPFIAGDAYTVADIAALRATPTAAATRAPTCASTPHVAAWLDRVEATPGFVNDLAPFPDTG